MGQRLGFDFGNALPITSARIDPRQGRLYDTILRTQTVPPEHISGMGALQVIPQPVTYGPSGGYVQPGGGVKITGGGVDINIGPTPQTPGAQFSQWLDESSLFPPYPNKWVALAALAGGYLLFRRR